MEGLSSITWNIEVILSHKYRLRRDDNVDPELLTLVCDLDNFIPQGHTGSILLSHDGALLGIVFHEGNALTAWDQPHLAEAIEAAIYRSKRLNIVFVWDVLQENDLVWREIFVRNNS